MHRSDSGRRRAAALPSDEMKTVLVVLAIVLLLAVGLPLGMGAMGDCPMCTSPQSLLLGLCGAIAAVFVLTLSRLMARLALYDPRHHLSLLIRAIFRPPRLA